MPVSKTPFIHEAAVVVSVAEGFSGAGRVGAVEPLPRPMGGALPAARAGRPRQRRVRLNVELGVPRNYLLLPAVFAPRS